jgi:hypothetical protein
MLLIAVRSSRRRERAAAIIAAAEKFVLAHGPIRSTIGAVVADGAHRVRLGSRGLAFPERVGGEGFLALSVSFVLLLLATY